MSFDIFVVTCRVTNFWPKLVHMPLFSVEKNLNFHFLNSPIFGCYKGGHPSSLPLICPESLSSHQDFLVNKHLNKNQWQTQEAMETQPSKNSLYLNF